MIEITRTVTLSTVIGNSEIVAGGNPNDVVIASRGRAVVLSRDDAKAIGQALLRLDELLTEDEKKHSSG